MVTRRHQRGDTLLEVLLSLALLSIAIAGCAQALLQAQRAQSEAALHERTAWALADGGELVQAWPGGAPAAQVAAWQSAASMLAADDPARPVTATLQPGVGDLLPARRWQATLDWNAGSSLGDGGFRSATFVGYVHALAAP